MVDASVVVRTGFDVPPNRVRQIILEAVRDSWGMCSEPAPSVVTSGFTDAGVEYAVRFFTVELGSRARVESAVRDRIWYALDREGIALKQVAPPPSHTAEEMLDRRKRQLAGIDIFSILPEPALCQLAASVREQRFASGEAVVRQGDKGHSLYLVEDGDVAVTARQGTGPEVKVAQLGAGAVFGEFSLLTGARGPRP